MFRMRRYPVLSLTFHAYRLRICRYTDVSIIPLRNIIRAMRTAKGWTQEELGNKFDVSPQYISRIERGSAHLSLQKLYVLAGILECSIYAILPSSPSQISDFFSDELQYQLDHCSAEQKAHLIGYITWYLQSM